MAATWIELFLLAEIRFRESDGNYGTLPKNPPHATASGAYQFINATWNEASAATGIGKEFGMAYLASPSEQDANALWLLRTYGANSSHAWKASGRYPSEDELSYAFAALGGGGSATGNPIYAAVDRMEPKE